VVHLPVGVHLLPLCQPRRRARRAAPPSGRAGPMTPVLAGLAVVLAVLNGYSKAYSP